MWPSAVVTAQSHLFWEHQGEGASRNLPLIVATKQVAKVSMIPASIPALREEVQTCHPDLGKA